MLVNEVQNGFYKNNAFVQFGYFRQQSLQKSTYFNIRTFIAFVDCEKAIDRVNRNRLFKVTLNFWILKIYPKHLVRVFQSLCNNACVRTIDATDTQ